MGLLQTKLNANLEDYIGDYYHISNSWEIPVKANEDPKKRIGPTHLHLDDRNNLFADLETVQRVMVQHYKMTTEGTFTICTPDKIYFFCKGSRARLDIVDS